MTTAEERSEPGGLRALASRLRGMNINLRDYALLGSLVFLVVLFQILTDGRLLSAGNPNNLIMQNAYVMILAIGMVMVIIAGHIDLSVGSLVAMLGALLALMMSERYLNMPMLPALVIILVVGAVVGAWQGFWVAFVGVPAFIVTLAGMLLFRGFALVFLTGGTIGNLPSEFVAIGARWLPSWMGEIENLDAFTLLLGALAAAGFVGLQVQNRRKLKARDLDREAFGLFVAKALVIVAAMLYFTFLLARYNGTPIVLLILGVLVLAYSFVLNRTVFGRHVYAMGGNRFAARMSGVKTKWVDFFLFVNIGVLSAVAAIVTTARAGSAVASAGNFFELDAIAAVFIGGAAVQGGVGRISGTVIGALIMGVLNQGLSIMGVDAAWQQVFKGLVLLIAVAFDVMNRRKAGMR